MPASTQEDTVTTGPTSIVTPVRADALTLDGLAALDTPFAAETAELLAAVRDHDLPTLEARCDDDHGIIDLAPDGGSMVLPDRAAWRAWFAGLFAQLSEMGATTDSLVETLESSVWTDAGMSVLTWWQSLSVAGATGWFRCQATIVWKRDGDRWVEARWHASLLETALPEGFPTA
jgi:hypothetical protein